MKKWQTDEEIANALIEYDHEGENALRTLEDARDSIEVLGELGMKDVVPVLKRIGTLIDAVLEDRRVTGNYYNN